LVGAKQEGFVGYVSLTVFARHVDSPEKLGKKVDLCLAFRHYLHYHIKAAKTNLHMRMRRKVRGWLQVLNRAALASEAPREKKTISGRTFTRK
jgi:actin related protein 2/3 complex subunit 2